MPTQPHSHFDAHSRALGPTGRYTLEHHSHTRTPAAGRGLLDSTRRPCEARTPRTGVLALRPVRKEPVHDRDLDWGWNGAFSGWLNAVAIGAAILAAAVLPRLGSWYSGA